MAEDSEAAQALAAQSTAMHGLVWGFQFDEDGCATPLEGPAALEALAQGEVWVWLHFDLVDNRARAALQSLAQIPQAARTLLLGDDNRQQLETFGQVVAGVVSDFERSEELDPRRMLPWRFCMMPHAFISARRTPLHTMSNLHAAVKSGRRFPGVLQLFDGIVHGYASALAAVVHDMALSLDEVEDGLLDSRESGDYEALGTVRRRGVRLHRQALPLQALLRGMLEDRPDWFTEAAAGDCERVARRVDSVVADLVALQERSHALQDEFASRQAEITNRRLMLLSVISAVLLPPTLISGVFGMNVDGLPLKDGSPYGFLITMGMMAVSIVALMLVLRKMKLV